MARDILLEAPGRDARGTARHEAPQEGKGPEQEVGTPEVGRIGNSKAFFVLVPPVARSRWRLRAAMAATSAPSGCGRQPRAARPSAA